jgi:chromosome partitioning protein
MATLLPLILAFAGGKGGVGKSTLAVCVAVEWGRRGLRVLMVDADDAQRSILTWAEVATQKGMPRPDVIALGDEIRTELPRHLERKRSEGVIYDVVIIDCPGEAGRRTTYAVASSSVVLFPCTPAPFDVWRMDSSLQILRDVRAETGLNPDAAIVITAKDEGTTIGRELRVVLEDGSEVPVFRTELRDYVSYKYSIAAGKGVTTYEPTSEAANDVRAFVREIEKRFNVSSRTARSLWERAISQLKTATRQRGR